MYGPTNVGKTTFVEKLIGEINQNYIFYPGVGKFCMQDFRPMFHKIILFEEFHYEFYPKGMLKRLLEGRKAAYPVKCSSDSVFSFSGPIIFVSNENNVDDDAIKARLKFVEADVPFWTMASAAVPKEEEVQEEEVFQISSDEETAYVQNTSDTSSNLSSWIGSY